MPAFCLDPEGFGPVSPLYYNFTPCFINAVVPLLLAAYMFALAPRELKALRASRPIFVHVSGAAYTSAALVLVVILSSLATALTFFGLSHSVLDLRVAGPLLYAVAVVLAGYIHYTEYFRVRVTSGAALFFWLFTVVAGCIRLFGYVQRNVHATQPFLVSVAIFSLLASLGHLLLCSLASKPSSQYELLDSDGQTDSSPLAYAHVFSRLTFSYLTKLMKLGYNNYLTEEDLPDLPYACRTDITRELFDVAWQAEKKRSTVTPPSLARALFSCFGSTYLLGVVFKLTGDVMSFMQPNLLRRLIVFVNSYNTHDRDDEPIPVSAGFIIAIGMFTCSFLQTMFQQQYFTRVFSVGMNVKSALTSSIYRKAMFLSNDGRQAKSTGDIVNLMAVDVSRLQEMTQSGQALWSGPFQIILCLYNLHALVGNSMWAGVAVTMSTIVINAHIAKKQRALQKIQMKVKDKRTRLTGEILVSIKSIKLYAWEDSFIKRLHEIRNNQELKNLRTKGIYSAIANFIGSCAPFFVSCSTFALFVWTSDKPLSTDIVFPALTLFNLLSQPLSQIPQAVTQFVETIVSATRLRDFLITSELQPDAVSHLDVATKPDEAAVLIKNGTFLWDEAGKHPPALKNVSFEAKNGQLACIVGRVGAGKSALLQSILGDMYRQSGRVVVRGHVAYCSQVPWIMNATVKENILFGKRFHAEFYDKTVHACALIDDFSVLPDGDETIVGEKGISLSGGQKARLALARAVYTRADVYILDDPLSAVDQHVGRHIIDNVLGPRGLLASKTKVMATNAMSVLAQADSITMLRSGEIIETGLYDEVMSRLDSQIKLLIDEFGTQREQDKVEEETAEEKNPLADTDSEEDDDMEAPYYQFGAPLRRASTASFKKPSLIDDIPNRRSRQIKEHSEKGQVKFGVYKEYMKAANLGAVITFLVLMVCSNSMSVSGNFWLKHWSDINTRYGDNPNTARYLGIYLILGTSAAMLTLVYTLVLWIWCTIRAARNLHDTMLKRVLRSPMSFFDTTPLGRIINRFTADVNRVDEVLARVFTNFFTNFFKVLFSLVVISSANPVFMLFILPIAFLYIYNQKFYLRTSRELKRLESVSRSPIYAHFQESLNGVSTIRAFTQVRRFNRTDEYHIDFNNKAYYPSMIARRWLAIRLEVLGSSIIFLSAFLAILAVVYGNLSSGLVGLTMSYAFQITAALSAIVRMTVEVEISTVSVERILEYCGLPSEAPEIIGNHRPPHEWPSAGAVEFHDYSTRYRPGLDLVLRGINLKIKPKEKIGIVGRTGAGKSSLTLALFRMIEPVGGYVSIDGINTSKLGLQDLREHLSIIPQDSQAFEGTVRDNLDPANRYTDADLWHALKLSHLSEHIRKMEGGLHAMIMESGSNMSVGQRQLMSLARALLTPSKILVLDEATAAVDVETDQIIQETIRTEFKDRTILTIAHRLNTIIDSDKIVVLAAGKVVEFDTPTVLLANKASLFYSLCKQGGLVE
ncbi:P-loop containing nucleoside triphosphate hydrolase protein [Limtongia smithiae]|uniref:P-loop containing nucleoside triphosphate hydrolase protein n=1 Tax=Limtongia smithiae TaxID=1125753 RepID=UPI0034CF5A92